MPDLVTHVAVAYLFTRWTMVLKYSSVFYVGTILPDLVTRPFYILFPNAFWAVLTLHAPIPLFFVCCLITYLFDEKLRKGIFISLASGAYLHLSLDLFQKHIEPEFLLFFPFSWKTFEVGLFWAEDSLYAIPVFIFLILFMEFISRSKKPAAGKRHF
jgi:hypothetical protein